MDNDERELVWMLEAMKKSMSYGTSRERYLSALSGLRIIKSIMRSLKQRRNYGRAGAVQGHERAKKRTTKNKRTIKVFVNRPQTITLEVKFEVQPVHEVPAEDMPQDD